MQQKRLIRRAAVQKEPGGFFQPAAGVEQFVLARDRDLHSEIVMTSQILHHHVGEVVDIENDLSDAEAAQPGQGKFKQRFPRDFY